MVVVVVVVAVIVVIVVVVIGVVGVVGVVGGGDMVIVIAADISLAFYKTPLCLWTGGGRVEWVMIIAIWFPVGL